MVLGESFAFSFLGSWATPCQLEGLSFRTGFEGWNVAVEKCFANLNQNDNCFFDRDDGQIAFEKNNLFFQSLALCTCLSSSSNDGQGLT